MEGFASHTLRKVKREGLSQTTQLHVAMGNGVGWSTRSDCVHLFVPPSKVPKELASRLTPSLGSRRDHNELLQRRRSHHGQHDAINVYAVQRLVPSTRVAPPPHRLHLHPKTASPVSMHLRTPSESVHLFVRRAEVSCQGPSALS
jgi:hypothetical protein